MKKIIIILIATLFNGVAISKPISDREYWVSKVYEMSKPVLENLSRGELKKNMPIEQLGKSGRENYAHLEAVGRLMCGISPWLELPTDQTSEGKLREELLSLAHKGLANAVDPGNPDYLNFRSTGQPLVDAAFLAQAFLRSPDKLWGGLDEKTKGRFVEEFKATRRTRPPYNNWVLFSAMIEAFLLKIDGECDLMRTEYAFRQIDAWYVGDGQYSDGPKYHNDYYNSFVIQPMLLDAGVVMNSKYPKESLYSNEKLKIYKDRAMRYAAVLERSISPEGTFPVVGRSILYRTGCMQSLSQASLLKILPKNVSEGQVRAALTTVMKRMLDAKGSYKDGWLTMGFCGSQAESGEYYLCTGSMYLASAVFLPLGLPADDTFWNAPTEKWTTQKAWGGEPFSRDASIGK